MLGRSGTGEGVLMNKKKINRDLKGIKKEYLKGYVNKAFKTLAK
jgi:hypothetical protein